MTTYCEPHPGRADDLLQAAGQAGPVVASIAELREHLNAVVDETTIVMGSSIALGEALTLADALRVTRPRIGVILVREWVDTALLSQALRAGVREVLTEPELTSLSSAVQRSEVISAAMRAQGRSQTPLDDPDSPQGGVISVFSAKGGCGKTTLATNLAAALADRGRHNVVLVDLDLAFGDVAISLQLFPRHTIADAVPLGCDLDMLSLSPLLTAHSPGLTALFAPLEPGLAAGIPAALVTRIITILRANFDYVVIDTPPSLDDDRVLAAFDLSDTLALIATLDVPALKNLKLTLETLDLLNVPRERTHVVLNRADSKVGLSVRDVEDTLRRSISLQIPSSRDVPSAINRGVPILLDDPKHPVSTAIFEFARTLAPAGAAAGTAPAPPARRRLLRGSR